MAEESHASPITVGDCTDLALARVLFTEYLEATIEETGLPNEQDSPGVLTRMRNDIAALPGPYAPEVGGALLAARNDGAVAGSVGLARIDDATVELCRLWVRPRHRRDGVARALVVACLERATRLGYTRMVLDVVPQRTGAIALYQSLGFVEIEPYDEYPFPMVFLGREVPARSRLGR